MPGSCKISGWIDFSAHSAPVAPHSQTIARVPHIPGLHIDVLDDAVDVFVDGNVVIFSAGRPRFARADLARAATERGQAAAWAATFAAARAAAPQYVRGSFAVVILDISHRTALLATDRFGLCSLCFSQQGARLAFADRADAVARQGPREYDPQAIYDYLYFHVIPAPRTIFKGVQRVPAAQCVAASASGAELAPYWTPRFEEDEARPFEILKAEFLQLLRESVARETAGVKVGSFLSGGTDSSTVAGLLGETSGAPAKTYSIGFDAQGYDEMEYARLAARHFRTEAHEYYLTPADLAQGIPAVAAHYDQPFGNSSAVPAFFCAKMAHADGIERLLAGDGGDELFGGNVRYAKQRVFAAYDSVPALARRAVLEPVLLGVPAFSRVPVAKKAVSYIRQARLPMPERMNSYNLLMRLGVERILSDEFLAQVDPQAPARQERATYRQCEAQTLVNRMLAYDWKYTLADNDLPKVVETTHMAGVSVGFPLLSDELVDFSLRLEPELKLKGLRLRYFFKEALRGFLPDAILSKKKHGFGLPFGVWLTQHAQLRELAFDSLASLKRRGHVRGAFIDELVGRHVGEHPGYYGEMVWILMMLEQWLAARKAQPADTSLAA
jgi:asparagine synthase (glutamine-hydrolysing)